LADGAKVKMQMGIQVRLFKGGSVFLLPYHLTGNFLLNAGKVPAIERNWQAFPFLAATVAEKTEIKDSIAGIIS
jgi:hypothetical protein